MNEKTTRPNVSTERANEIEEAASEWLIRRDSQNWTEADQLRFDEWFNASTLNRVAYLRLELAWEDAARLKALGAGIRDDQPPPRGQWNLTPFFEQRQPASSATRKTFRHRRTFFAIAATILLAVGIGAYVALAPSGTRYTTPVGEIASVPMRDGSKVTLNTDSQIRVTLTDSERRVDLKYGEAFFEVSKDPKRPFVVNAGGKRVVAVGTQFSVRRDDNDIQVVVTEGKVRVEDTSSRLRVRGEGPGGEASRQDGSADVFLTPGSVAHAGDAGVLVQRKTLSEAEQQLSWRVGVLMFRDQSLSDAIAEFNRYNVQKIVIGDPAVAALKIEGNFRATNVDAFVRLLESGFPVRATVEQDRILLTSK